MKMKVGDSRQAIILGVVAISAIGFMLKTLSDQFTSKISNAPMVVKDLRGGPAPTAGRTSEDPRPEGDSAAKSEVVAAKTEETSSFALPDTAGKVIPAMHDPFATVQSKTRAIVKNASQETITTDPEPMDPGYKGPIVGGTLPKGKPEGFGTGDSKQAGDPGQAKPEGPAKGTSKLRLTGCVDAGRLTAIFEMGGQTINASVGDAVEFGFTVETITDDQVVLRKGKQRLKIFVGREVEIK